MEEYLEKIKNIQQNILEYIDEAEDSDEKFQKIKDIFTKNQIQDNKYELKLYLYFLSKISKNHHHTTNFSNKINRFFEYLKDDLRKFYTNSELFDIFKGNKRNLLFLIEAKIINIDESIVKQIIQGKYIQNKYPQYFQPEIQPFIHKKWFPKYDWILEIEKELPIDFYELRKIGENDRFICELIRKDSINEFIVYMNKNNYKFDSRINPSIYETNNILLKYSNTTLIEYAVLFCSMQIFNYLRNNGVELTDSLWYFAIHGRNAEIIQILEENQIKVPVKKSYKSISKGKEHKIYEEILKESIKCHHNEIADYIQNNYIINENEEESKYEVVDGIKYRNFKFIEKEQINEKAFYHLCKYDYYTLVSILLNTTNIDINHKTIYKINHFNSIFNFEIMNDIYIIKL